jgi:hypothetical protein
VFDRTKTFLALHREVTVIILSSSVVLINSLLTVKIMFEELCRKSEGRGFDSP